ncbi:MAG: hypothetical protein JWO19_340 [Bryobacterales bacterium]|nr:hypothetical protein [Bryobacterales bacterium]
MRRLCLIVLIAGWTALQLPAQLRITGLDGLASKAKESVDITLDSSMLQMAGGFLAGNGKDKDQAKIKELLNGLKAITVKSFEFKETGQYRMEDLEPIRAQLRTPGWSRILNVQSKEEISEIYTRTEQGKVVGFAIIAAEPKELTVVAIEGTIDLKDLSKLGGLGVPAIPVPEQPKDTGKKGKQE